MPRLPVVGLAAAILSFALPTVARAADPIMPLGDVHAGMRCTGLSVVRATTISAFDVEVIDVVRDDAQARILVRAGGPAVDDTGIGQGFSGSPVLCPDGEGTARTIGAISEGTGDYGNKLVLVTPIESMLGETPDPPAAARYAPATLAGAHALRAPLSFGGVSGPVADALRIAARRVRRPLLAAPAAPRAAFPVQELRPGASVAVGLASGDLSAGAVGTVTYVDGDKVWAFGHELDAVGRRSLLLQDAYVYAVIGVPQETETATAYKLASPGHDLGTLVNDAPDAVVGRVGPLPERYPLRVTARDLDTGRVLRRQVNIVDENALGLPTGGSVLAGVGPVAIAQTAYALLRGSPARQSGDLCVRITIRERKRPLRFCNRYVGGTPGSPAAPMVADFAQAAGMIDAYNFGVLHVTSVDVNLGLRRDLRQAFLLKADAPDTVRRGRALRVRVTAQRVRGERFTRTIRVRVPRSVAPGERELVLSGTPADGSGEGDLTQDLADVFSVALEEEQESTRGPAGVEALAGSVAGIARREGVSATFREPGASDDEEGDGTSGRLVLRDRLRLSGTLRLPLVVTR